MNSARPWAESLLIHALILLAAVAATGILFQRALAPGAPRPPNPGWIGVSLRETRVAPTAHAATPAAREPAPAPRMTPAARVSTAAVSGARRDALATLPPSGASPGGTADSYLAEVRAQIDRSLVYPLAFRTRHLSGKVTLHLVLDASGALRESQVVDSSGIPELDRFAMDAVQAAGPFPADPAPKVTRVSFNLPIELKMR